MITVLWFLKETQEQIIVTVFCDFFSPKKLQKIATIWWLVRFAVGGEEGCWGVGLFPTTIVYILDTQETLLLVRGNRTIWTVNEIIVFKYCIGIFFPVRTKIERENHFWCSLTSFRGWRIFFTHTFLAFFNSTITPPPHPLVSVTKYIPCNY